MPSLLRRTAVWWRAIRFHYIPPSYLPAILGAVAARATTGWFHFGYLLITVLAVTANHAALNLTDDYYDYLHAVDRANSGEGNPYAGGSGALTSGQIRPGRMRLAFYALYAVTAAAGAYLAAKRGWPVLAFGLFGGLSSFFYTAPPVRYAYRGFGELSQLVNFSLTIGLGSFYVQAQQLSWRAALLLLPLGFMMFSMIMVNEIPDEPEDRRGGKRNLVVVFGPRTAVGLYGAGMAIAYALLLAAPLAGAASYWTWLALLTLPWFGKAFAVLRRHYRDPLRMAPANLLTIRIHNLTGILLIAACLLAGPAAPALDGWMATLLLLLALYLPVAFAVFVRAPGLRRNPRGG